MQNATFELNAGGVLQLLCIARQAGDAVMAVYTAMRKDGADEVLLGHKEDASPLTQADMASHEVIVRGLRALSPSTPIVSEEDTAPPVLCARAGEFWLIDPLDGTKEFLSQSDEFTVNIALARDGKAVFGVVLAPAMGLLYWGGPGLGAFREIDGQRTSICVAALPAAGQACRVVASKSHINSQTLEFIAKLGAHSLVTAGSSLKICKVADGAADVYPRLGLTSEWDTAAAHAIVEAAGGCVSGLDGGPLTYGKSDILNPHFVVSSTPFAMLLARDD